MCSKNYISGPSELDRRNAAYLEKVNKQIELVDRMTEGKVQYMTKEETKKLFHTHETANLVILDNEHFKALH